MIQIPFLVAHISVHKKGFSLTQIDMTFFEHRILLLQTMRISLREKQYTVAYIHFLKK